MTKDEEKHFWDLYNIAKDAVKDEEYIPSLTPADFKKRILKTKAVILMTPEKEIKNVKISKYPNVFFHVETGNKIKLGLHFNNKNSTDLLCEILSQKDLMEELHNKINSISDNYKTILELRIEYPQTKHMPVSEWTTNKITKPEMKEILGKIDVLNDEGTQKRKESKKAKDWQFPSLNLLQITIPDEKEAFIKALKEIINVYDICNLVKPPSQIKKIKGEKERELERLKKQRDRCIKLIDSPITKHREEAKKLLPEVEKKIAEIERELGGQ